jgi:hypothetical protein
LGIFDAGVRKFPAEDIVPHMGWNTLTDLNSTIFNSIGESEDVYYVHGYYCELSEDTTAVTNYILPFSASFQKENFYATHFTLKIGINRRKNTKEFSKFIKKLTVYEKTLCFTINCLCNYSGFGTGKVLFLSGPSLSPDGKLLILPMTEISGK